jgi:hypothetical protein
MRCPICRAEGKKHALHEERVPSASAPVKVDRYYDVDDKLHVHDYAIRSFVYTCSNGHHFKLDTQSRCPCINCDWNRRPQVVAGMEGLERYAPNREGGT